MAWNIPGITQPFMPIAAQDPNALEQLPPPKPNSSIEQPLASRSSMTPDSVKRSDTPSRPTYNADVFHRLGANAHAIVTSATAATIGAAERLTPTLGQVSEKAVEAGGGAARAALPIAGDTLGAAGLLIATQSPAGESEADLAKTRAVDAARRQNTTFPGERIDVGPNHTTLPAHVRVAQDGIFTTPVGSHAGPAHTGHAAPDLRELTKPTGTAIHQLRAADQATLAQHESAVTPAHAAHRTAEGTLANADRATGIDEKLERYSLNDQHADGMHKARVFQSVLGYDRHNVRELGEQIKEGIKREPALPGKVDEHGVRFTVDVPVKGPAGEATVRTGWIYRPGANDPSMITGFVK